MDVLLLVTCTVLVSYLTTKVIATHYFEIVDRYVQEAIQQLTEILEGNKHQ